MSWSKNRWPKPIGPKPPLSRLALAGFVISAIAVAAAAGAGLGTRAGWWNFREGFRFLRWGAYFGAAGTAISASGGIFARPGSRRRGFLLATAGIVVIRISPAASGGSVLDIRSVSRVGLSDIGTNARRIRTFLKTFSGAAKAGS